MLHLARTKTVAKIGTGDTTTAQTASHTIDTLGYAYASIDVVLEPASATTDAVAIACKVEESDASGSGFGDIAALVGGGTGGFTIPSSGSKTADSNVIRLNLDLRGHKRYLKVSATPVAASVVATVVRLGRGEIGAVSASDSGVQVVANA
jgi:hypothetical protein